VAGSLDLVRIGWLVFVLNNFFTQNRVYGCYCTVLGDFLLFSAQSGDF
jgi:hypothetical protein